jgi:hypothetical protein
MYTILGFSPLFTLGFQKRSIVGCICFIVQYHVYIDDLLGRTRCKSNEGHVNNSNKQCHVILPMCLAVNGYREACWGHGLAGPSPLLWRRPNLSRVTPLRRLKITPLAISLSNTASSTSAFSSALHLDHLPRSIPPIDVSCTLPPAGSYRSAAAQHAATDNR